MARKENEQWLDRDDPSPTIAYNAPGCAPFLLTGDHAGSAFPRRLETLGVGAQDLARHITCDWGVRALGEALAERVDAPFLHQYYSRLVIDCNRDPASPEAVPMVSDGTVIPGNQVLDPADRAARIAHVHTPYQDAIAAEIARRQAAAMPVVLIALHSFTPVMAGQARPWHVGILHGGGNPAFALHMLEALRNEAGIVVGDNQPYRMDSIDYSVPRHAFGTGIPCAEIPYVEIPYAEVEVRQDMLATSDGVARWCDILSAAMLAAV